jgi:type III secretion protein J
VRPAHGLVLVATCLALSACQTTLRSDLSELEANHLLVALDAAAIAGSKVAQSGARDRYQIEVASSSATRALAVLEAQRVQPAAPGFEQLYTGTGMWTTPDQERARYANAVAGELARSIERLEGVLDARVHLALPAHPQALDERAPEPKAAVLIRRAQRAAPIDEKLVRALVAGAVDGLAPEHVSIAQLPVAVPAITAASYVQVGPFAIERSSAGAFKALLAGSFAIDLGLALALIWAVRRARAVNRPG